MVYEAPSDVGVHRPKYFKAFHLTSLSYDPNFILISEESALKGLDCQT
jgi:hypothetical protein